MNILSPRLAFIRSLLTQWLGLVPLATLALGIVMTVILSQEFKKQSNATAQNKFAQDVQRVTFIITDRMHQYVAMLRGAKALFSASQEVSREEWSMFYQTLELSEHLAGIQAFAYSKRVGSEAAAEELIAQIRNEGYPDFTIRPDPKGRDDVHAIVYIEPMDKRNKQAFGYDMYSQETRHLAMDAARDSGKPQLSGKVKLVQEIDEDVQPGTLLYVPVYANGASVETVEERRGALVGFAYAAFRMKDLLEPIVKDIKDHDLHFSIYDDHIADETVLFASEGDMHDMEADSKFLAQVVIDVAGRQWVIRIHRNDGFIYSQNAYTSMIVFIGGLTANILLYILIVILLSSRKQIQEKAQLIAQELVTASTRLQLATSSIHMGVWDWDVRKNILVWDDTMYKLYGIRKEDYKGVYEAWSSCLHPDDLDRMNKEIQQAIRGEKSYDTEFRIIWPDKSVHFIEAHANVLKDQYGVPYRMIGVNWDITERKKEREDVKIFQYAVDSSTDSVAITDTDMRLVYVNPAWEKDLGYTAREIAEKPLSLVFEKETNEKLAQGCKETLQRSEYFHSNQFVMQRKSGTTYMAEITMYPIIVDGKHINNVVIHHDISERQKIEKAKTDFLSLASHRLRTPLTNIRWTLDSFLKGKVGGISSEQKELLSNAHQSAIHMTEVIRQMLTVSHIESSELNKDMHPVDIAPVLQDVIGTYQDMAQHKNQALRFSSERSVTLDANEIILKDILSNLLDNAVRYTPVGGTIEVRTKVSSRFLLIEISDTGYGIPAAQQDKVFTKFFRGDNTAKIETEGTGLGLYLVYALTKELSGDVVFVSEEGKGTTFTLRFPLPPH